MSIGAPTAPSPEFAQAFATQATRAATVTPMRPSEAEAAISDAYRSVFGSAPSKGTLAILVSQWSLETGGGRAMMNYNFGGIKGRSPSGHSVSYATTEGSGDATHSLVDSFRAYGSPQEGAVDYVRLLRDRFPAALSQARARNPAGFVHALKTAGYFTGSEKAYTEAVSSTARTLAGSSAEMAVPSVDVAAFSYQLDLAALRIGSDPSDR
jgi:hypothetical protein